MPTIDRSKLKEELVSFAISLPLMCKLDLHNAYSHLDEINIEDERTDDNIHTPKVEACNG